MKIKIIALISLALLFVACEDDPTSSNDVSQNTSWTFVANEGIYDWQGPTNTGTITMVDSFGNTLETEPLGDIVQALEVYNNKLVVSVNNSQKILIFDISAEGISNMQEIQTDGLSPREISIIDNKAYITFWDSDFNIYPYEPGYVKVLNLNSNEFEGGDIQVGIMPEGMAYDSNFLWVANSGESSISKIDVNTNSVIESVEVGRGPQNIVINNGDAYISRTFYDYEYDDDGLWTGTITTHGSSKISGSEVTILNYGSGVVCGGSVLSYNNQVYRSYNGGIFPIDENLELQSGRIGDYNQNDVYHVEIINDNVWFGLKNSNEAGMIKVVDNNSLELMSFQSGINPGDFAIWNQ